MTRGGSRCETRQNAIRAVQEAFAGRRSGDMQTRTLMLLAVLAGCAPKTADTAKPEEPVAGCTEEAKVCPDGSTVAREGPDCEFPACPGEDEDAAAEDPEAGDMDSDETPEEDTEADADGTPSE